MPAATMFSSSVCMVQPTNWSPNCPPPSVPTPMRTPAALNFATPRASRSQAWRERSLASGFVPASLSRNRLICSGETVSLGHARGDAVVGEPVHVVEDVLARIVLRPAGQVTHVSDVGVGIDQRGNDRLPR